MPSQRRARETRRAENVRRRERAAASARAAAALGEQQGCLFCRERDGGFTGREHIIAESLGNDSWLLPAGIVCDRCNNGTLARLDNALVNDPGLALMRAIRGVRSKTGRLATARFDNATITRVDEDTVTFESPSRKVHDAIERGSIVYLRRDNLGERHWELVARALLKIGLERMCAREGPNEALATDWDPVRDFVLYGGRPGYVWFPNESDPHDALFHIGYEKLRDQQGRPFLSVYAKLFGMAFITDSRHDQPRRDVPAGLPITVMEFGRGRPHACHSQGS
jgi:hypothetical protein